MKTFAQSFTLLTILSVLIMSSVGWSQTQNQNAFDQPSDGLVELPQIDNIPLRGRVRPSAEKTQLVYLQAVLEEDGNPIQDGLIWRVFDPKPTEDGKYPLIATAKGGSTSLDFKEGDYFVHVAFGRAGVTKRLSIVPSDEIVVQKFVLDAGGLILDATAGDFYRIDPDNLRFSIYSGEDQDANDSERQLVLAEVPPNVIVRLNEGVYHVVSHYGDINAVTRANVRVEKGQLTEVRMQHRAAKVSLKLVSRTGGEAIANTAWSIYSESGDFVREIIGAFPNMILAEGGYTAVAMHQDQEYTLDFTVKAGLSQDVEVMLN